MAKTLKYVSAPWKVWISSAYFKHLFAQAPGLKF
jgi:hypothetical protein